MNATTPSSQRTWVLKLWSNPVCSSRVEFFFWDLKDFSGRERDKVGWHLDGKHSNSSFSQTKGYEKEKKKKKHTANWFHHKSLSVSKYNFVFEQCTKRWLILKHLQNGQPFLLLVIFEKHLIKIPNTFIRMLSLAWFQFKDYFYPINGKTLKIKYECGRIYFSNIDDFFFYESLHVNISVST